MKDIEKTSFMMYLDWLKYFRMLPKDEAGELILALLEYQNGEEISTEPSGMAAMAFAFMCDQFERDNGKYLKKVESNRENGAKGGRPPKKTEDPASDKTPVASEKPNQTQPVFPKPKKPDTDTDTDTDTVTVTDTDTETDKETETDTDTTPLNPPGGTALGEKEFEKFWDLYPKKIAKENARRAWERIKPDEALVERILEAVDLQKWTDQWKKEDGKYIPHPTTWLNQHRWEDDLGPNIIACKPDPFLAMFD